MFGKEREKERSNYDNEVEIEGENELETCKQKNTYKRIQALLAVTSLPCPSLHDLVSWKLLGILCSSVLVCSSYIVTFIWYI